MLARIMKDGAIRVSLDLANSRPSVVDFEIPNGSAPLGMSVTAVFVPKAFEILHRTSLLPNVQDEPRPWLARLVLLGARDVTAMVVGSGALLAHLDSGSKCDMSVWCDTNN